MVVLGIVLIVLAVALGLGVLISSTGSTMLEVFGVDFGVRVPTVFFLGAALGVAFLAGLWLTKRGLGRSYRRRKEIKELRQQAPVPGFRPGHAPQKLIEKRFASDVRDQVRRTLISESYEQAIEKMTGGKSRMESVMRGPPSPESR